MLRVMRAETSVVFAYPLSIFTVTNSPLRMSAMFPLLSVMYFSIRLSMLDVTSYAPAATSFMFAVTVMFAGRVMPP